jgi:ligand-binding sensor domain-containing protein
MIPKIFIRLAATISPGIWKYDTRRPAGKFMDCNDRGLNKLNRDRTSFYSYFHNPDDAYSLSSNAVVKLHIDSAGVLYAACWGGKLNKANLNSKSFGLRRHDPDNINSLSNNKVTTILEDSSGIIWIGTYGGGLNRWNRRTNHFTHFRHNPSNPATLTSDTILALLKDLHGHIWVCNGDVLSKLKNQNGEFIHYYSNVNNYKDGRRFIYAITEDREGIIWLATGNGLKRFDEKKGEFQKHYFYDPANTNGISDYGAKTVYADSRDNIWVGYGSRATDRYNKKIDSFIHYKHDSHDSTSISQSIVNSFFEDSKGNLWLGTLSGGLCSFDYQQEKFKTFTDKHGLPANNVYSVLTDNKGRLWLGTSNGLSDLILVQNVLPIMTTKMACKATLSLRVMGRRMGVRALALRQATVPYISAVTMDLISSIPNNLNRIVKLHL